VPILPLRSALCASLAVENSRVIHIVFEFATASEAQSAERSGRIGTK